MNSIQRNFRSLSLDTSLFRKIYLMLISFEMIAFLDVFSLVCKSIVLIWGLFILVHNFFIEKIAFKIRYKYLLWSFLILMIITSIVHMSIWFIPNLVITYFTAICFFVFYGMYKEKNHEDLEKEMVFILKFFVNFSLIFGVLSLISLFFGQDSSFFGYYLGIFKNRLIGVYTNSNILAFSMIEGIVSCDILSDLYIKNKFKSDKLPSWKLIVCPIVNCLCLFLSDSNASFVFLIIYWTIRVFCNLFFKCQFQYTIKLFRSILITLGFCLLMMSVSFALRDCCQNFINTVITDVYKLENSSNFKDPEENIKENTKNNVKNDSVPSENNSDFHIGREHYEVSSGRITLFKQGLKIFKNHPWIGIGRANLKTYGKKYIKGGLIHPDLHNGYLTILVSCGIIGFLIFAVFSFLVSLDIVKYLFVCLGQNNFGVFCKLFSALVAYCGYCLFEKAILFDMTFMVGFFWSILGYTISYIHSVEDLTPNEYLKT